MACAAALPPGDARTRRRRVVRPTTKLNTFRLGSLKFCSNNRLFSNQKFLNYSLLSLFLIEFFRFNQKIIGRKKLSSIYITKNTVYLSIHLTVKKKTQNKTISRARYLRPAEHLVLAACLRCGVTYPMSTTSQFVLLFVFFSLLFALSERRQTAPMRDRTKIEQRVSINSQ